MENNGLEVDFLKLFLKYSQVVVLTLTSHLQLRFAVKTDPCISRDCHIRADD